MRNIDYPVPDYAAYIWHRGDALGLVFPDYNGNGHTVFIPIEKLLQGKGTAWLIETLARRHSEYVKRGHTDIGTDSEPTAEMLAHALRIAKANPPTVTSTPIDIFAEPDKEEGTSHEQTDIQE